MIVRFFSLAARSAVLRRALWRFTYEAAARCFRDPAWTCMNYGYDPAPGEGRLMFGPGEQFERFPFQLYERVIRPVRLAGLDVLEVGCGRGGGAAMLARHERPRRLVGLDAAGAAVAFCRRQHSVDGLSFERGDAEALPFPPGSFDVVINVESSHCYGSFAGFLAQIHRVLRAGGRFLYADFRDRPDVDAWRRSLVASGMALEEEENISPRVVAALELDANRRREFIQSAAPGWLKAAAGDFAGLPGTRIHRQLAAGDLEYRCFSLRKMGPDGAADPR